MGRSNRAYLLSEAGRVETVVFNLFAKRVRRLRGFRFDFLCEDIFAQTFALKFVFSRGGRFRKYRITKLGIAPANFKRVKVLSRSLLSVASEASLLLLEVDAKIKVSIPFARLRLSRLLAFENTYFTFLFLSGAGKSAIEVLSC